MSALARSLVDSEPATARDQTALDLIGEIGRRFVEEGVKSLRAGTVARFSITGLSPAETSAIARAIAVRHQGEVLVGIHPDLATADVPPAHVSRETAAAWRNLVVEDPEIRGIVFAVPAAQLDSTGETLGALWRVAFDTLTERRELWLDAMPTLRNLTPREKEYLEAMLDGLRQTGLVHDLGQFAAFVTALDEHGSSMPPEQAINCSLPTLRLPRNSGSFKKVPQRGRLASASSWRNDFDKVVADTRHKLQLRDAKGAALDRAVLMKRLGELVLNGRSELDDGEQRVLTRFIENPLIRPGNWQPVQHEVVAIDWPKVAPIFDAGRVTKQEPLGEATVALFIKNFENGADRLTADERELLDATAREKPGEAEEEHRELFERYREVLRRDPALFKRWERFVFRQQIKHDDLLVGMVTGILELLRQSETATMAKPRVRVVMKGADDLTFWAERNTDLARYLRQRWQGLDRLLAASSIDLDFGMCWKSDWFAELNQENDKTSASACTFPLEISIHDAAEPSANGAKTGNLQAKVEIKLPSNSVLHGFELDRAEILGGEEEGVARLLQGSFHRNRDAGARGLAAVDLANRGSFIDCQSGSTGQLLGGVSAIDLADTWRASLARLSADGVLTSETAEALGHALDRFMADYATAIGAFGDDLPDGIDHPSLLGQAERYGELLHLLRRSAANDRCRRELWHPLLTIGIAYSSAVTPSAIVTPFQPLRLAEIGIKARHAAEMCGRALGSSETQRSDMGIYIETVQRALTEVGLPGVAMSALHGGAMMIESDRLGDYSLTEPLAAAHDAAGLDSAYTRWTADAVISQSEEYLELQPHERASFSLAVYNAENEDLPHLLTDRLSRWVEDEGERRCDLILSHETPQRLQEIYEKQNAVIGRALDAAPASDASSTFLSRLRVGFTSFDETADGATRDAVDIVLLQDTIARSARAAWRERATEPLALDAYRPAVTSPRLPLQRGDMKTASLLVPAGVPAPVQHYLDLIHDLTVGPSRAEEHFLPIREVDFSEGVVRRAIDRAHRIGRWVVTCDAIADRRLFEANGVRIIRHVSQPGAARNVIVSTKDPGSLLRNHLRHEMQRTALLENAALDRAVEAAIDNAIEISGRIVLRAARLERNALELLGLVLSRRLVEDAVPKGVAIVGWLMLDDFSRWLGYGQGDMADILAVALDRSAPNPTLRLLVIESKYVGDDNAAGQARKSAQQLVATVEGLRGKLVGDNDGLGLALRRERLAQLLLEHVKPFSDVMDHGPTGWLERLRDGSADIAIAGLSAVFTHDSDEPSAIRDVDDEMSVQLSIGRGDIRRLVASLTSTATTPLSIEMPSLLGSPPAQREAAPAKFDLGPTLRVDGVESPKLAESEQQQCPRSDTPAPANDIGLDSSVSDEQPETSDHAGHLPERLLAQLAQPKPTETSRASVWLAETTATLKRALIKYGMQAPLDGEPRLTPNAALINFKGSDDLTLAMVEKRRSQLLTSHGLHVTGVLPGRGRVTIMIAREKREIVRLDDALRARLLPDTAPELNTSFLLGVREDNGEPLYLNLGHDFGGQVRHDPHTLIAGGSGSGKGVLTQTLLLDICATNSPANASIVLVDPKYGADYGWLRGLPHLRGDIVTSTAAAIETFDAIVEEMERRYDQIVVKGGAINIDDYNRKVPAGDRLPRLYFFHDEMGDWMADATSPDYQKAVESRIVRLASKSRAAGIHLFLITQRPDKDALPSQIKANAGNRICLKVASQINSQIILDQAGGEDLLGRGHMAAKLAGDPTLHTGGLVYAQTPFADIDHLRDLAIAVREHWASRI